MRWRSSAAYRTAFAASLAYGLATVLLGVAVYFAAHAAFATQLDQRIDEAQREISVELNDDGPENLVEAIVQRGPGVPDGIQFALFDAAGHRRAGTLDVAMPALGWSTIGFRDPVEGVDPARAKTVALANGSRLVIAADLEPLEAIDRTILTMFGAAFIAIVVFGILGALVLGGYLRQRLKRIETTASAIIAGDLSRRAAVGQRGDEFDQVALSLNAMLDRIAQLIQNLRQVTSDLAHDLRTPLTRLHNGLETLRGTANDAAQLAQVDAMVDRSNDVLSVFDAILRIAELEEGSLKRGFARVDLNKLSEELYESHVAIAEDQNRRLELVSDGAAVVEGDRELLAQAMINLIENALRHSGSATLVTLGVRHRAHRVELFVADDGVGIEPGDVQRATERFVRFDPSRSTPGHGLGLSLVAAIARAHGAELMISEARPGVDVALSFSEGSE